MCGFSLHQASETKSRLQRPAADWESRRASETLCALVREDQEGREDLATDYYWILPIGCWTVMPTISLNVVRPSKPTVLWQFSIGTGMNKWGAFRPKSIARVRPWNPTREFRDVGTGKKIFTLGATNQTTTASSRRQVCARSPHVCQAISG